MKTEMEPLIFFHFAVPGIEEPFTLISLLNLDDNRTHSRSLPPLAMGFLDVF
jgi:hypothetical protein